MATNFKHLEFLPLDEENLIVNDNPESNLKSKSCLNLGFIALNSLSRQINIATINRLSSNNDNNFLDLTYILESLLITSLNINSITTPDSTDLTNHYKKRQTNVSSNKILPNFAYCQNLVFTNFKTWGGFYGTLSYYINLLEDYEEYLTPSEVIYYSTNKLLEYSRSVSYNAYLTKSDINYSLLSNFYLEAEALINQDTLESDKQIYNLSINLLLASPLVKEIFNELIFYEKWLVKVLEWKATLNKNNVKYTIINNPSTNLQKAVNSLLRIVNIIQEEGFGSKDLINLSASFIRQNYPKNLETLINKLNIERVEATYIKLNEEAKTTEEILITEYLDRISKFRTAYDFNKASNIIQETFTPPGGYALFLITLANTLFNRAYILAYTNIKNKEELITNTIYKRIVKLIGYACILLIKTNLPHAEIIALNTLKSFKIYLTDINPDNLLDIY